MSYHAHGTGRLLCSLLEQINKCSIESTFDHKKFVPQDCVDKLVNSPNVEEAFDKCLKEQRNLIPDLTKFITRHAPRCFLILSRLGKLRYIIDFFGEPNKHKITNRHLPIFINEEDDEVRSQAVEEDRNIVFPNPLEVFRHGEWAKERGDIYEFCNHQWAFVAPIFQPNRYDYGRFDHNCSLPFTYKGKEKGGGFSRVYEIQVRPAHYHGTVRKNSFFREPTLTR